MGIHTPLHVTTLNGYVNEAKYLLSKGADVAAKNYYERTPLHWVSYKDHFELANYLLEKGAEVHARDDNRRTPLHWAALGGSI